MSGDLSNLAFSVRKPKSPAGVGPPGLELCGLEPLQRTGMSEKALLRFGVIGAIVTAVCCFTPVLIVLLGTLGLSAVVGYLDYVLLPALAVFVGIILYALWKRRTA